MTWECLNCGLFNDDEADKECLKCGMDKAEAMTMNVINKKKFCPECGHMHKWNVYCHCFTESFIDEDDEEEEEEDDDEDDDDEDDEARGVFP